MTLVRFRKSAGSQTSREIEIKQMFQKVVFFISYIPQFRGGVRRISSSAFLSRRSFGYYLPIASYGTAFAAKWSSNGGLEAMWTCSRSQRSDCSPLLIFVFLRQMRYFLSLTVPLS